MRSSRSSSNVPHGPLEAQIYAQFEDIKSELTVASQIIQAQLPTDPSKPVKIDYHPVVLSFPIINKVILVNLVETTASELHDWAETNQFNPGAMQSNVQLQLPPQQQNLPTTTPVSDPHSTSSAPVVQQVVQPQDVQPAVVQQHLEPQILQQNVQPPVAPQYVPIPPVDPNAPAVAASGISGDAQAAASLNVGGDANLQNIIAQPQGQVQPR